MPFLVSACEHELDDAGLCAKCGGHLVPTSEVEEFARRRLRMEVAELRELAAHYPGGRVPCPSCGARMNELPLKGVTVDLCSKCGSLWTDEGELAKLADA